MSSSPQSQTAEFINAAEAARRLGVSAKALRLYEERGLLSPVRSAAGWRAYGPDQMARAAEIAGLRALGFSLGQVARLLRDDRGGLESALAAHQAALEGGLRAMSGTIGKVRTLRDDLARGAEPSAADVARLAPAGAAIAAFDLPWPWGGERFELRDVRALTYIVGSLGSGKTRLALALAAALPNATFLGLERTENEGAAARAQMEADPALKARVDQALAWLVDEGASASPALTALLAGIEAEGPDFIVVDLIEQDLDGPTQEALSAHLRRRGPDRAALLAMTRSSALLDLAAMGPREIVIYCPANHSPPMMVLPYPGSPGYEAVETCLAPPDVRARTEGMRAVMR